MLIKWFPGNPGTAAGLAITGFGGGAMKRRLGRLKLPTFIVMAWTLALVPLAWGFLPTLGDAAPLLP